MTEATYQAEHQSSLAKVSVVIPSYQRHQEVLRAVRSALRQSVAPCEVIVANDGADARKGHLLADLQDDRVVYTEAPRLGNSGATRNHGIRLARGEWIALLDDDDVWLPRKLEAQLAALNESTGKACVLVGAARFHMPGNRPRVRPWPKMVRGRPADRLLFDKYGGVATSTVTAPRQLFLANRFDESTDRHEDWQWLLEVERQAEVVLIPEVICERNMGPGNRVSQAGGYRGSRAWYLRNRGLMSRRGRAAMVSGVLSRKAAYDQQWSGLPWLLGELMRQGQLPPRQYVHLLAPWLFPGKARLVARGLAGKMGL